MEQQVEMHRSGMEVLAKDNPAYIFVWFDTKESEEAAVEELGCAKYPCVSLVIPGSEENEEEDTIYTRSLEQITPEEIASFLQDVIDSKVDPFLPVDEYAPDDKYDEGDESTKVGKEVEGIEIEAYDEDGAEGAEGEDANAREVGNVQDYEKIGM